MPDNGSDLQLDGYGSANAAIDTAFRVLDEGKPPKARRNGQIVVCAAADLPPGEKRIVDDPQSGLSLGVFNLDGTYYALKNVCPHQGAPLCAGSQHATHRPGDLFTFQPDFGGRILRCPWHGWEFDIVTGKGLYDATSRVATYPVEVDGNGDVVIRI